MHFQFLITWFIKYTYYIDYSETHFHKKCKRKIWSCVMGRNPIYSIFVFKICQFVGRTRDKLKIDSGVLLWVINRPLIKMTTHRTKVTLMIFFAHRSRLTLTIILNIFKKKRQNLRSMKITIGNPPSRYFRFTSLIWNFNF